MSWEKILKEQTRPKPSPLPDWFENLPDEKGFGGPEFDSLEEYESQDPQRLFEDLIQMTDDGDELATMLLSEIERELPVEKVRKMLKNIMAELNNPERGSNF